MRLLQQLLRIIFISCIPCINLAQGVQDFYRPTSSPSSGIGFELAQIIHTLQ